MNLKTAMKQEMFKLTHRKLPWLIILLLLVCMVVIGIAMGKAYSKLLVMTCYDSSDIIMLILVIVGSTIFSMEFQDKTILGLLYRSTNRRTVFMAKFLTLFLYDVFLHLVAMLFTIFLNLVPIVSNHVSWTAIYQYHQSLWINMLSNAGVDLITSMMIVSLICLISCLINSNTIVIVVNALVIFMGSSFSANLLNAHVGPSRIIRWNPLNMLNLTTQYYNYGSYHPVSMLSNGQLLTGALCYIILFTVCGYWAFSKKRF